MNIVEMGLKIMDNSVIVGKIKILCALNVSYYAEMEKLTMIKNVMMEIEKMGMVVLQLAQNKSVKVIQLQL